MDEKKEFRTMSGVPVAPVYGDGPLPGEFPYTRGIHSGMYRDRLWTMRMFAGFGTAEDTNVRFKDLLRAGGTGLSTAFDMPTLMGRDSDDEWSIGEVGRAGVAIDTLDDMIDLFADIDLGQVSTSMTINGPAAILLAMYVAVAEQGGVERSKLNGTLQNDILKEYQAQKEYIFPPRPSVRLVSDVVSFTTHEMPRWNPISISGYHIREAGSTAAQELAFTLANGFAYVEAAQLGVPSIGGKDGGASDAIKHNETGIICDGNSLEDIYSSIDLIIKNNSYLEMGKKAKEYSSKFDWGNIVKEYLRIL